MKVLVVGGGGREHALAATLAKSPRVDEVLAAPGNGGMEAVARCRADLLTSDVEGLRRWAREEKVDLTVVGPEAPLVQGIVDLFRDDGLVIFGPTRAAARLEGSKAFAKQMMVRNNVPTAAWRSFTDADEARAYVRQSEVFPLVVKADGLAAGKGVAICEDLHQALAALDESMSARRFGDAGARVVVEEYLRGEEASIHAITDGDTILVLPSSQDHKRALDGDAGPNTGGMGAYSPAPVVEGDLMDRVIRTVLVPTIHGMKMEGAPFAGVLYAGLMVTKGGPRVLEFNVRFGDPEAQVVLPRLETDLFEVLYAAAEGRLASIEGLDVDPEPCVGVVIASQGYPGAYQAGKPIRGLEEAAGLEGVEVFHAGTRRAGDRVVTAGGRVLCVTGRGPGLREARDRAYEGVQRIDFEGAMFRTDIAHRALSASRAR